MLTRAPAEATPAPAARSQDKTGPAASVPTRSPAGQKGKADTRAPALIKVVDFSTVFPSSVGDPQLLPLLEKHGVEIVAVSKGPPWVADLPGTLLPTLMLVGFLAPLTFAFLLGWLCSSLGLSGIVGGLAAGLILSDESLRDKTKEMLIPLIAVFTPIFFLLIGLQVNLAVFLHWGTLALTLAMLLVAVAGKVLAALTAGPTVDRATIAMGMLPRGEVALIFVGVGKSLGVIDDALFAALVLVIILLAFGSRIALKWVSEPRSPRTEALLRRLTGQRAR